MRVDEAIRFGADRLQTIQPDARREASWLLAAALGVSETSLRIDPGATVRDAVLERYRQWIERRAGGEPAHHLLGWCDFWGRRFTVSPAVLVPRPETEFLVEAVLQLPLPSEATVADLGTGSGCIAWTLKAERPRWRLVAVDISMAALDIAERNRRRFDLDADLVRSDLGTALGGGFHLVTANLPYIPSADIPGLPAEVHFDPKLALDGGPHGLDLILRLLEDLGRLLVDGGFCALELGETQADRVCREANEQGLDEVARVQDLAATDRIVILRKAG